MIIPGREKEAEEILIKAVGEGDDGFILRLKEAHDAGVVKIFGGTESSNKEILLEILKGFSSAKLIEKRDDECSDG